MFLAWKCSFPVENREDELQNLLVYVYSGQCVSGVKGLNGDLHLSNHTVPTYIEKEKIQSTEVFILPFLKLKQKAAVPSARMNKDPSNKVSHAGEKLIESDTAENVIFKMSYDYCCLILWIKCCCY